MSVLVDTELGKFNSAKINPASINLTTEESVVLEPGDSVLLSTVEVVELGGAEAGLLVLRTSAFRKGLALASPGWVDPGYTGQLTFRVTNVVTDTIRICAGEQHIQMVVFRTSGEPERLYSGKYQGSRGAVGYIPDAT